MQQTKTLIKILQKLGIDDPDTIALFTPTVQFIIWILLGIGVLIGVREFWERSQRLHYNETYTKIYKVVLASAGGIGFLMCATLAFAAIDSPMATSLVSLGMYFASPIMILLGVCFLLSIYDYAKQTHTDEGEEIKTWHKISYGFGCTLAAVLLIYAGVIFWGKDISNLSQPTSTSPSKPSNVPVNPNDAQDYFDLGNKYYDNGEYEKAVDAYKKYIAENPQYADIYYNLGFAYWNMNDNASAAENYRRATELDPQNAVAYFSLGVALAMLNRYDEALQNVNRAIELNPQEERYRAARDSIINLRNGR